MLADNLFEWDRTSFGQGVKNWATRQRDEWMGTPDAMARHNIRLAANKLYTGWRMYLVQTPANPPLQGTNVDLANYITRYYGADKIGPLNNLVKGIVLPTPPPAPAPTQAESRRGNGRLVEAPVQQQQQTPPVQPGAAVPPPPPPAQPAAAAPPPAPPPAQPPAQPAAVLVSRAQVDKVFVALAQIMLDSGEAKPGMKQRKGRDDEYYDSDRSRGGGGGGGGGMKISELTNVKISADALEYAERSTRVKLTDANHILALIKNNMQPTIAELVKKYPVTGNNMLVLLAAAQAS